MKNTEEESYNVTLSRLLTSLTVPSWYLMKNSRSCNTRDVQCYNFMTVLQVYDFLASMKISCPCIVFLFFPLRTS